MGQLTDFFIRNVKHSGARREDKYSDGDALWLHVSATSKFWRVPYRSNGKQKSLALGEYPVVTLAEARAAREQTKKLLSQGIDPSLHKQAEAQRRALSNDKSFYSIAEGWFKQWSGDKAPHTIKLKQRLLNSDLYPILGKQPIEDIETPQVILAVRKVHERGARDIAGRALNTCDSIFRYAIVHGLCKQNPVAGIKPRDILPAHRTVNHARVSQEDLPQLIRDMSNYQGTLYTRSALMLMALTFVRTSELIQARWSEFDIEKARWLIPAERMKMRRAHIVHLAPAALKILAELRQHNERSSDLVFPSETKKGACISNMTVLTALYRMGYKGVMTGHGYRGVASTILHEHGFNTVYINAQLAHKDKDQVSSAYNHAQYLQQRKEILDWWAEYVDALASTPHPEARVTLQG